MPEEIDDVVIGQIDPVIVSRLVFSIVLVLALYFVVAGLRNVIRHRVEDPSARFGLTRAVNYVAVGLALIVLGIVWLERPGGFSIALGFVAAGAVATREVIFPAALLQLHAPLQLPLGRDTGAHRPSHQLAEGSGDLPAHC